MEGQKSAQNGRASSCVGESSARANEEALSYLRFLDAEISAIEKRQRQSDWIRWVLLGAFACCFWLASLELERNQVAWDMLMLSMLTLYILSKSMKDLIHVLTASRMEQDQPRIFTLQAVGLQIKRFGFMSLILSVALLAMAVGFSFPSLPFFKATCIVFFSFQIVLSVLTIVSGLLDVPLPNTMRAGIRVGVTVTSLAVDIFLVLSLHRTFTSIAALPSVAAIRFIGIAAAAYWALRLLADATDANPLLPGLQGIRRRVALGSVELPEARTQTQIVFSGTITSHYFQPPAADVMAIVEKAERHAHSAEGRLAEAERSFTFVKEQGSVTAATELIATAEDYMDRAWLQVSLLKKAGLDLESRTKVLAFLAPEATEELMGLYEELAALRERLESKLSNAVEKAERLKMELQDLTPVESND